MGKASDERLVRDTLDGSADAAAELFRRHWSSSWQVAYGIVGRRALADDVAQDAFQRAFGALSQFDLQRSFPAWLHRIVVNRALDVLRSERRLLPLDPRDSDGRVEPIKEQMTDRELFDALSHLDPERRAVIALRYWLDYSPWEIASLLNIPIGTVSSRLSRALAELRQELEGTRV